MRRNSKLTQILIVVGIAMFALPSLVAAAEGGSSNADIIKHASQYASQYAKMRHVDPTQSNEFNNEAIKVPDDAGCLVCHSGSGFMDWAAKGFDAKFNKPAIMKAGEASGTSCVSCHDPEAKPKNAKDPMLRLMDETPVLTAGYAAKNAGTGAVCMVCHNSRRGLYNEKTKPVMDQRSSHETAQTDFIYGQNLFFYEIGKESVHAGVDNTCVGCHMATEKGGSGANHDLKATWEDCAACHDKLDAQAVKKEITGKYEMMKKAYVDGLSKMIQAALDAGNCKIKNTNEQTEEEDKEATAFKGGKLGEISAMYFHGAQAFKLKIDGKELLLTLKNLEVQGVKGLDTAEGQILAKAGWNLYMIEHDRSMGAHAPDVYKEMLDATTKKLKEVDYSKVTPLKK